MSIIYEVSDDGHFIHAIVSAPLTSKEFVDFEIAHAIDERIKSPVAEIFEVKKDALKDITRSDIDKVIERRKEIYKQHTYHRCAVVVSLNDSYSWSIAKFYEGMSLLHFPESVIVFGDIHLAKVWLGIGNNKYTSVNY